VRLPGLLTIFLIGAAGCGAGGDESAPPKAQPGALSEVRTQAPPTNPPPDVTPAPKTAPAPPPAPKAVAKKDTPNTAPPSKQPPRGAQPAPGSSVVTRDAGGSAPPRPPLPNAERIPTTFPPTAPPPAPPKSGYTGPSTGTLRWFGTVEADGVVEINADRSAAGTMTGALPGVPVLVQLVSKDVVIIEAPAPANAWRRLRLRSRVKQSALIIQWTVLP
jgi:hypothetical protein